MPVPHNTKLGYADIIVLASQDVWKANLPSIPLVSLVIGNPYSILHHPLFEDFSIGRLVVLSGRVS